MIIISFKIVFPKSCPEAESTLVLAYKELMVAFQGFGLKRDFPEEKEIFKGPDMSLFGKS